MESHVHCEPSRSSTLSDCALSQVTRPSLGPHPSASPLQAALPVAQSTVQTPAPQPTARFSQADVPEHATEHACSAQTMLAFLHPLLAVHWTRQSQPGGHAIASPSQAPLPPQSI